MQIGERIRQLRAQRDLSQGDIEKASGLLRCYISRVEKGRTVPSLETLERFAHALDVPLYRLFFSGDNDGPAARTATRRSLEELADESGPAGTEARLLLKLRGLVGKLTEADRALLIEFARRLSSTTTREPGRAGDRRITNKPAAAAAGTSGENGRS